LFAGLALPSILGLSAAVQPSPDAPSSPAATQLSTTQPASTRPIVPLPEKWNGTYKGTVDLLRPGRAVVTPDGSSTVAMELIVTPADGKPGTVSWTIVYGTGEKRQERPYELSAVPGYANRFLMDEKNGILIDHALIGEVLVSQFRVGTALLVSRFELVPEGVQVEISSFQTTPSRKSRPESANLEVESYPATTIQRGLLKRQ
jgi:hypothetical protein